jgi:hypothetical protein
MPILCGAGFMTVAGQGCSLITRFDPPPSADAAAPASPSCMSSGALLCEDFEHAFDMGKWNGGITQSGGTVTIDGPPNVHWGSHSLHLRSDASAVDAADTLLSWKRLDPTLPTTMFLRAFIYWNAPVAQSAANSLEVESADRTSGYVLYEGQSVFGWSNFGANVAVTSGALPTGAWTCVEWKLDAASGDVQVSVNGNVDSTLSDTSAPFFPFAELDIGMMFAHDQVEPVMDSWMDDVVVDDKPIGCDSD